MEREGLDQIGDIANVNQSGGSRLERKISKIGKPRGTPCIYFDDMVCKTPFCDMEICSKCPKGCSYCTDTSMNPLRKMLHKIVGIIIFLVAFIGEESMLYEVVSKLIKPL